MSKLCITPAAWTGVAETDPRESRLNTSTALAVIVGGYRRSNCRLRRGAACQLG